MKWRHTRENLKSGQEKQIPSASATGAASTHKQQESNAPAANDEKHVVDGYSSDDSSYGELSENEDEIDVVQWIIYIFLCLHYSLVVYRDKQKYSY